MESLATKHITTILAKLDKAGVEYLGFNTYNEEEYSEKYQAEYVELFYEVVVDRIFKHFNVDPQDTEIGFNYFVKENGKWFVSFYEPEELATIDDILDNDYSSLKELSNW